MNAVRGGLHLQPHKDLSTSMSIFPASIPQRLTHVVSRSAQILVKPGERVLLGQPLAVDESIVIHASVSGTVKDIATNSTLTIAIDNDRLDE